MLFVHTDEPAAVGSHPAVGEAQGSGLVRLGRQHDGVAARFDPAEPLIVEVDVEDDAVANPPSATPVLVNRRAHVRTRRSHVEAIAIAPADQHRPALLLGAQLRPPDVVAIWNDLSNPNDPANQRFGRDRRRPGSGAALFHSSHHDRKPRALGKEVTTRNSSRHDPPNTSDQNHVRPVIPQALRCGSSDRGPHTGTSLVIADANAPVRAQSRRSRSGCELDSLARNHGRLTALKRAPERHLGARPGTRECAEATPLRRPRSGNRVCGFSCGSRSFGCAHSPSVFLVK